MKKLKNNINLKNTANKIIKNENFINYFIIIIVGIIISIPLMQGFVIGHDCEPHISRVMSTVIALKSNQGLPILAPNYVNGLGYSWNLFYPPLTNYFTIIFKFVCDTYINAMNLLVSLTVIISGFFMYHFTDKVVKSKKVGLLAAIIYMTIPYRVSNIYVRYALGEIVSFIFIPLVFNGLYSIFEEEGKRNYLLTIGAVGLLLTHNITTLLIIFTCVAFVLLYIRKIKNWQIIKDLFINVIFILVIVVFFYGPFLEARFSTNYAVFNEFTSENKLDLAQVNLWEIIFGKLYFEDDVGKFERISVAIGFIAFLNLILTPFVVKKIDNPKRKIYLVSAIIGAVCIFASSKYMKWKYMPEIFKFLQFPYRLLIIATFLLSIISAVNFEKILKNLTYKKILIITLICIVYILPLLISAKVDTTFDENVYYEIEKNELPYPGCYSIYCSTYEYLPSKAYNNLAHLFQRNKEPIILTGEGEIQNLQVDENKKYTFGVKHLSSDGLSIEMPLIYYPGYTVLFNGEKLNIIESNLGLIMFSIPENVSGDVEVSYTGTLISKVCMVISIIGVIVFLIYILLSERTLLKKANEKQDKKSRKIN